MGAQHPFGQDDRDQLRAKLVVGKRSRASEILALSKSTHAKAAPTPISKRTSPQGSITRE
jgi:hypothetical protein